MVNVYNIKTMDVTIGKLIETWGNFGQELRIELDPTKEKYYPLDFKLLHNNYCFDDKEVMEWIKDRITPRTQDGIEEKLKEMGMSEYVPWDIFRYAKGMCFEDDTWVQFEPELEYRKIHPRYRIYQCKYEKWLKENGWLE